MGSSLIQSIIFWQFFLSLESQVIFWSEPMDSTSLPSDWTSTGITFGTASCPSGTTSCWEFTTASISTTTTNPIDTLHHTDIAITYKARLITTSGPKKGSCSVEYASDGTNNYQTIATYDTAIDTTEFETFSTWSPSADQNANGISLRISTSADIRNKNCYFSQFSLEGVPVVTSLSPTASPDTASPTNAPNTAAPSAAPNTAAPTSSPDTSAPSSAPVTASPVSSAPPTTAPVTLQPSSASTVGSTASVYVNDVFKFVDITISGNSPHVSFDGDYSPVSDEPYISLPLNLCTRNGDDLSKARRIKWQCSGSNDLLSRCIYATDEECETTQCTWDTTGAATYDRTAQTPGYFAYGVCGNGLATTTENYLAINYYRGWTESAAGCPGTPFVVNGTEFTGFEYAVTDRFATGVCVAQDSGNGYILTTCDINSGEIALYDDAQCTQLNRTLVSYDTACWKMNMTSYVDGGPRYFRRFAGCYVNSSNIVRPTIDPTAEPTQSPTHPEPSVSPVASPTAPSASPVTRDPTSSPSESPVVIPTTSANPSVSPTAHPVTPRPSRSPVYYTSSPTRSPTQSPSTTVEKYAEEAVSLSLIQYSIGVLVIVYALIACGVWCNERNKRLNIMNPSDRRRKRQFADARNRQREREMQMQSMDKGRTAVNSVSYREGDRM